MTGVRTCRSCGAQNPLDRDFCTCGEYLRWEPTTVLDAVDPAAAAAPAAPEPEEPTHVTAASSAVPRTPAAPSPVAARPGGARGPGSPSGPGSASGAGSAGSSPRGQTRDHGAHGASWSPDTPAAAAPAGPPPDTASLTLRLPESEEPPGGPVTVVAAPGTPAVVLVLIRNESSVVDNYDLQVEGLPESWWTFRPGAVYLVPYGASGTYEQEVALEISAPRSPDAKAGATTFAVVAHSRATGRDAARTEATVELLPFADATLAVDPKRQAGRRGARFQATVRNRGNAPSPVHLEAVDQEGACPIGFAQPDVNVPVGAGVEAPFRVRPPKPIWLGRPVDHLLTVSVTVPQAAPEQAPLPVSVTFRQKPWLPWWLAVVVPLLAFAVVLLLMLRTEKSKVPDLRGKPAGLEAQKLVDKAGLVLSPQVRKVPRSDVAAGVIVDQSPAPGKEVKSGTAISLQVAVGSGKVAVPPLAGLRVDAVDALLRRSGLALGAVQPTPNPKGIVATQLPAAGQQVASGTPINLTLVSRKTGASGASGAAAGGGAAGAAAGAGAAGAAGAAGGGGAKAGAGGAKVPKVAGTTAAAAEQAIGAAGLSPTTVTRVSDTPPGTVIGTQPPAGGAVPAAGTVTLVVSAGFPRLAYDNGADVFATKSGGEPEALARTGQLEEEPTWLADGQSVIYRNAGQLWLGGARSAQLTTGDADYRDPAVGHAPAGDVLATLRVTKGDGDLCFAALTTPKITPKCIDGPAWHLGNFVRWSPDGLRILTFGVKADDKRVAALYVFQSKVPFSTNVSDWDGGRPVSDLSRPGRAVVSADISPDGRQLAVATNLLNDDGVFRLALTTPDDLRLDKAKELPVPACEVAWRPDSAELAVRQGDCSSRVGTIVRIDPKKPTASTLVTDRGGHAAWQPLAKAAP